MQELLWKETIKKHRMDEIMRDRGVVIIGYSGGADSSCLLHLMNNWDRKSTRLNSSH